MSNNLEIWNRFADIDPAFTKKITGKPYQGTSPNPHYIIRCLTELFGPVGVGFGWDVVAEGFEPLGEEVLHWCRIRFWHGEGGKTFDAYGQTKAYMKTRNGLMLDEDAPKKSLTDAITKAAAQVGVAANIFLGRWDDNKYVEEVAREHKDAEAKKAAENDPRSDNEKRRDWLKDQIENAKAAPDLHRWWRGEKIVSGIAALPQPMQNELRKHYDLRMSRLDPAFQAPPSDDWPEDKVA